MAHTLQSVLIKKPEFLKATHKARHAELRKLEKTRSMVVEALSCGEAARKPPVQSPVHP